VPDASLSRDPDRRERWRLLVETMVEACREGGPREVTYWAQQLAYAPVVPHALSLWLRDRTPSAEDRKALLEAVRLGAAGLDALPDDAGRAGTALARLSRRQATAMAFGRRGVLRRLARVLGGDASDRAPGFVPRRLLRCYPLIGWDPPRDAFGSRPGA